jgi:hypothetical protein
MTPDITCSQCLPILPEYVAQLLDSGQYQAVRQHLSHCHTCQQELRLWQSLSVAVQETERNVPNTSINAAVTWEQIATATQFTHLEAANGHGKSRIWGEKSFLEQPSISKRSDTMKNTETQEPSTPKQSKKAIGSIIMPVVTIIALVALFAVVFAKLSSSHSSRPGAAHSQSTPTATGNLSPSILDIQSLGAGNVWAAGSQYNPQHPGTFVNKGLILHFVNNQWIVSYANPPAATINAISMLSADEEGWATGASYESDVQHFLLLHYANGTWSRVNVSGVDKDVTGNKIQVLSQNNVWVLVNVGGDEAQSGDDLVLHYSQGNWTTLDLTKEKSVSGCVAMVFASENDGWIGCTNTILHYTNGQWTSINSPTQGTIMSMSAAAPGNIWAYGSAETKTNPVNPFLLHYDGSAWKVVNAPFTQPGSKKYSMSIDAINVVSPSEGWVTAIDDTDTNKHVGVVFHYLNGEWSEMQTPAIELGPISMDSSSSGWAAGQDTSRNWTLLRYANNAWTLYPLSNI